ncbi:MAG: cyclic nucleotide-binding domain-containing protein [Desulfobacteraceae bacterium]|nr:cyclic nucleotide-binding domain-containing protein [Desulfobacteraceae bacterium]
MSEEELKKKEALAEQYVRENRKQEAVGLISEMIAAHAGMQNFEKAEALHEWLYEVDPLAISEIVKAADTIENEKAGALDENHLQTWSELYEGLSAEEANALYYSMKNADFKPGEVIAQQGDICERLYFINRGEAKAVFRQDSEELYIKTLVTGDIFGTDQFFSSTVCTVTLIAVSEVKTGYVEKNVLEKWRSDAPLLETRLFDFCKQKDQVKAALEEAGLERRRYKRIPADGNLEFQMLDRAGRQMGRRYKSELADISAGGVAFVIKTPRPEVSGILLGRRLRVWFDLGFNNGTLQSMDRQGRVSAVKYQGFDDYSVHLKFDEPLEESVISGVSGQPG